MKKYKMWKRYVGILVATFIATGLCGCSNGEDNVINVNIGKKEEVVIEPMEPEEPITQTFSFLGGRDVMPITGYHGPMKAAYSEDAQSMPNFLTDEVMAEISEAGINMLEVSAIDYNYYPEDAELLLDLGQKNNVGICILDSRIHDINNVMNLKQMDARLNLYRNHPAFCGVHVVDEPGSEVYMNGDRNIPLWAPIVSQLTELDTFCYANIFPYWQDDKVENYKQYVDEWCSTAKPKVLSYDYYVFDNERSVPQYFSNMDINRHYAEKYNLPLWVYIQAGGQFLEVDWGRENYPSEGQMLWNINTSLAYGVKGIQYFTIIQYHPYALVQDGEIRPGSGLLDLFGNRTQWFYYAQRANRQIAAVDEVLMNAVNKGVMVSGEKAKKETKDLEYIMNEASWREVASVKGDAMIGCYNYQGKTALYVVNYDWDYAQKITLDLHGTYDMRIVQDAEESMIKTNKLVLDLHAGEGALVVIEGQSK